MQFLRKPKDFSNEELMDMKSNLPSNVTLVNEISKRLETISSAVTDDLTIQEAVQNLLERYDRLIIIKASYVKALNNQFDREISTQPSPFNPSMGEVVIINRQSNQQLASGYWEHCGRF